MHFKRMLEISYISFVSMNIINRGGGNNLPRGKVPPPRLNSHVCFHFYVLIEGIVKSWSFEVSECPSRGYWKQFLISRPYEHSQWGVGGCDNLPRGKVSTPPPQPSCMLSLLCNDQRDSEEPGHLKFPIALQEDAGNNVSYLVPMNIVSRVRGNPPRGKMSLPPQPSCILSFSCNDQRD